jgi:nicotinamidase-related amidase
MVFVASIMLDPRLCIVLAIDLQDRLLSSIDECDRVLRRSEYLIRSAQTLGIQVLATTQNASKLGAITSNLQDLPSNPMDKKTFSAWRDPEIREFLIGSGRRQVVICGAETHVCVSLTAQDLLANGYQVAVCPDAVGSSSLERHKLGMERIRDAGAVPIHSEAVAYEWMESCDHPRFKGVLALTKSLC